VAAGGFAAEEISIGSCGCQHSAANVGSVMLRVKVEAQYRLVDFCSDE